jgi:glyoxylase-like metal-dependent hydrolase (beta-lactamase superfamily II)
VSAGARVDRVLTAGTFSLDGQDFAVENNVWLVGDDAEVLVIDPAHDAAAIAAALNGRKVVAILCTHGHNDHINAAPELAARVGAPVALHPDDRMLWDAVHPGRAPDLELTEGAVFEAGEVRLVTLHTPGHTPGAVCFHDRDSGTLYSGDTLFRGGPGATGRSYSDFPTIIASIRDRLLGLPPDTTVHPGHGDSTTIGAEAPRLPEWVARGH